MQESFRFFYARIILNTGTQNLSVWVPTYVCVYTVPKYIYACMFFTMHLSRFLFSSSAGLLSWTLLYQNQLWWGVLNPLIDGLSSSSKLVLEKRTESYYKGADIFKNVAKLYKSGKFLKCWYEYRFINHK